MILLTRIAIMTSASGWRLTVAFKSGGNFPRISHSEMEAMLLSIAGLAGRTAAFADSTGIPTGAAVAERPHLKIRFRNSNISLRIRGVRKQSRCHSARELLRRRVERR